MKKRNTAIMRQDVYEDKEHRWIAQWSHVSSSDEIEQRWTHLRNLHAGFYGTKGTRAYLFDPATQSWHPCVQSFYPGQVLLTPEDRFTRAQYWDLTKHCINISIQRKEYLPRYRFHALENRNHGCFPIVLLNRNLWNHKRRLWVSRTHVSNTAGRNMWTLRNCTCFLPLASANVIEVSQGGLNAPMI
jgi:hypothetical protein